VASKWLKLKFIFWENILNIMMGWGRGQMYNLPTLPRALKNLWHRKVRLGQVKKKFLECVTSNFTKILVIADALD